MEMAMDAKARNNRGAIFVRLRSPLYDQLENWRRAQAHIPTRSHALRLLIERALSLPTVTDSTKP
jgi:hypothetical protein